MDMAIDNNSFANNDGVKAQIRKNIQRSLFDDALNLVNELSDRDPDYYYFQAWIFTEKGWTQRAREYAKIATQMDPQNTEYMALWNRLNSNAGQSYKAQSNSRGFSPSCCEIGGCLLCSDCCCESMGGDLITCC